MYTISTALDRLFNDTFRNVNYLIDNKQIVNDSKSKKYYKDGMLHNESGPAVIEYNDHGDTVRELYFIEGERVTKEVVEKYKQKVDDQRLHDIYIGNKLYTVNGIKLREIEKLLKS